MEGVGVINKSVGPARAGSNEKGIRVAEEIRNKAGKHPRRGQRGALEETNGGRGESWVCSEATRPIWIDQRKTNPRGRWAIKKCARVRGGQRLESPSKKKSRIGLTVLSLSIQKRYLQKLNPLPLPRRAETITSEERENKAKWEERGKW